MTVILLSGLCRGVEVIVCLTSVLQCSVRKSNWGWLNIWLTKRRDRDDNLCHRERERESWFTAEETDVCDSAVGAHLAAVHDPPQEAHDKRGRQAGKMDQWTENRPDCEQHSPLKRYFNNKNAFSPHAYLHPYIRQIMHYNLNRQKTMLTVLLPYLCRRIGHES